MSDQARLDSATEFLSADAADKDRQAEIDHTAKLAEQYLRKGSKVYIEGQLETRKWQDQSGADRYTTEVVVRPYRGELHLLDGKRDDNGGGYSSGASGAGGTGKYDNPDYDSGAGGGDYAGGMVDDEIPF